MKNLIVFSSPSGGGKSTIVKMLLDEFPKLKLSTSATTRSPREGEIDGKHYHFLKQADFKTMIDTDKLIEWEEIFCNYYGTPKTELTLAESEGKCLIFDIDVKGAVSIKTKFPDNSLLIFIAPPSIEELMRRLKGRNTETDEQINKRMLRTEFEMSFAEEFDYIVINDNLDNAYNEVKDLLKKETQCVE
ncbi:MAG: guanylate kinase [Ignavibacteria bacterium GWF2_33_9]|nr:MAG: guanylate kinase [Ignavibacteria bacterium GWF2_33_9]